MPVGGSDRSLDPQKSYLVQLLPRAFLAPLLEPTARQTYALPGVCKLKYRVRVQDPSPLSHAVKTPSNDRYAITAFSIIDSR